MFFSNRGLLYHVFGNEILHDEIHVEEIHIAIQVALHSGVKEYMYNVCPQGSDWTLIAQKFEKLRFRQA